MRLLEHKKHPVVVNFLSLLLSFFLVFGFSFKEVGSWDLIVATTGRQLLAGLMMGLLFLVVRYLLYTAFRCLDRSTIPFAPLQGDSLFARHPFGTSLGFLLLSWSPTVAAYYPAILSPDPSFQIKQFFGIPNKYSTYVNLLDPDVLITNHHPVLHTLLLGSCVKMGVWLGDTNLGLFLYSLVQILFLSVTLALTILVMKRLRLPSWVSAASLLVYGLVPCFPYYSMTDLKDVIFATLILLYILLLYRFGLKDKPVGWPLLLGAGVLLLLIALFRNNGIHVILLSFPLVLIANRKYAPRFAALLVAVLVLNFSYNNLLLPALRITPGSVREQLSIPFQQTARLVRDAGEELTPGEVAAINKVLGFATLAERYNPELADPVKNGFNKDATDKDLKAYFAVWFGGLMRHPGIYIQATMNNVYGYFYPLEMDKYVYTGYNRTINEDGFGYSYNGLKDLRGDLKAYAKDFQELPVAGILVNIGFHVWGLFFMAGYLIYSGLWRRGAFLLPALALVLVCVASPANTYFRYALPFVMGMPLMIALFMDTIRKGGRDD